MEIHRLDDVSFSLKQKAISYSIIYFWRESLRSAECEPGPACAVQTLSDLKSNVCQNVIPRLRIERNKLWS